MLSEADQHQARFAEGDTVSFRNQQKTIRGTLIRMNPKRAVVRLDEGDLSVPYELLYPETEKVKQRVLRIESIQNLAFLLLEQHGLRNWSFRFDRSSRRAGCCNFSEQRISLAFHLARRGSDDDIRDTLLHEIAHALVGKKHNHDAVWKAKAREIGCSGERTHQLQIAPPRWSVTREKRCWIHTAQRRNSKLICRRCGSKLVYTPHSAPS